MPYNHRRNCKGDWPDSEESDGEEENSKLPLEKKFITSPAEVNTHRRVNLQDAQVSAKYREQFKLLCKEFEVSSAKIPLILERLH